MLIRLFSGLLFFIVTVQLQAETYRVTFNGTWNESDVSSGYPSGAHFTKLVGGTHISGSSFWESGQLATPGVESVAETGGVATLKSEVETAIQASTAGAYVQLADIPDLPGTSFTYFDIFQDKPEITLITMIAPSPDWFVGVSGLALYDQGGWVDSVTINLVPYDAGTEDGNDFVLSNPASDPQEVISVLAGSPFIGSPVIGQLTFERISAFDVNQDGVVDTADLIQLRNRLLEPGN